MKRYILKYSDVCKTGLGLFLAAGCNMAVEGHIWPDDILPYIFLVLNLFLAYRIDWRRLPERLMHDKAKIYAGILALLCILTQGIILRIYMADTSVIFIKAGIKVLAAGLSAAVILMLAAFEIYGLFKGSDCPRGHSLFRTSGLLETHSAGIPFISFCALGILYFYLVRRTADSFSLYPVLLFALVYLAKVNIRADGNVENAESVGIKSIKSKESIGIKEGLGIKSKESIIIKIGAICLALCETLGYMALVYRAYHGGLWKWLCLAAYGTAVWAFIFYYVLNALFMAIDGISRNSEEKIRAKLDKTADIKAADAALDKFIGRESAAVSSKPIYSKIIFAISTMIIAVRCLYWMNWFPALISKDTYTQMQQALGVEPYSNHHPWLHTMVIKACMGIGRLVCGSSQAGAAFTALASLLVSSILVILILKYYYKRAASGVWVLAAAIFIFDPIHCVYAITIWKDVLFAYALLAFCFMLMVMEEQLRQQGKLKPYMWFLYVAVSFVFCFSRTNGLYAWIFTLPFLLWHYRKNLKPWLISTLVCVLLIIGYKGWLLPHFQVTEPDMVESLSVPLQQIAFTIQNGGEFSEYDTSVINSIVDMESMGRRYDAHISDPVKNLIRDYGSQEYIAQNKLDFIKMYISVGVKNPTDYIAAFLNQSRGYWHQKMSNYIYFSEGVHRYAAELGIYRAPFFPSRISAAADKLMDKYCDIWHMFWSLALSMYVVLILLVYSSARKRSCFYFLPVIGVFITLVVATPVNDEFRYAYGIYLSLPLLLMNVCPRE